jgi:hypothetical protein
MKVILEWNGDKEDLMAEVDDKYGEDMTLEDSIIWLLDYGEDGGMVKHNNITIRKEEDETRN